MGGYDHGVVGSSSCGSYGGADLCGAPGTPVAMKDLKCSGSELDLAGCEWLPSSEDCFSHEADSVVFCSAGGAISEIDGSLRMLSYDGLCWRCCARCNVDLCLRGRLGLLFWCCA